MSTSVYNVYKVSTSCSLAILEPFIAKCYQKMIPRPYQISAVNTILQRFGQGLTRPVLSLATGLGKTICFGLLAKQLNTKTLILAHRDELLQQAADKVSRIWKGANIGILKGKRNEIGKQVVVASIQSACRPNRLRQLKAQGFKLCVVDECHHSTAKTYKTVLRELGFLENDPGKLLLGVSATVERADGTGLNEVFQEVIYHMGIREGIEQGYLSPLVGRQILSKVDLRGVGTSRGDFVVSELSRAVNTPSRNGLIVETYLKNAADRQRTLGFCVDIRHAEDLAHAFRERGVAAVAVSGTMDENARRQAIKDFSEGKYRILLNCMLLVEGFDESQIDCLLMARPTQSAPLFAQMIGRSTRLHEGKSNALILDFVDNSAKHRLCSIRHNLEGVVKIIRDYDEEKPLSKERTPQSKDNRQITYAGERDIDFFSNREFAWSSDAWKAHPASEKQKETLTKLGIDFDYSLTKGRAAELINEKLNVPATDKQRYWLRSHGVTFDPKMTKNEARRRIASLVGANERR